MADPWDNDPVAEEGWENDPTLDEVDPPKSKSSMVARDLSWFDPYAGFGTLAAVGAEMGRESIKGLAGLAGTIGGMWPGGESPNEKGMRYLSAVDETIPRFEPQDEGIQLGMEMVGKGAEMGVDATKYVTSPIAMAGAGAAGANWEEMKDAGQVYRDTPNALGEGTFQATGSPTMAVVAQLLPEVVAGLSPVKMTRSKPRVLESRPAGRPDIDVPEGYGGVGEPQVRPAEFPDELPGPSRAEFDQVRKALETGDRARLMELVNANPAIVAAFEELGIRFTPGMVSESQPLRQLEGGLASKADSGIKETHSYVETELNQRAKQLIDDSGGNADSPGILDDKVSAEFERLHKDYIQQEEAVWGELNKQIPRGADIDAKNISDQVEDIATNFLGKGDLDLGVSKLSKLEKELWSLTHGPRKKKIQDPEGAPGDTIDAWVYEDPTWEDINRLRQRIGLSIQTSGKGPFPDIEVGELKHWYGQLAEQQTRFAKGNKYEADWERMNSLTQERKALESAQTNIMGRDLQKSTVGRVRNATNRLLAGEKQPWDQLMADLPAGMQAAAQAEAFRTLLFTAQKNTALSKSFTANFEKFKRDPQIRDRLLADLPPASRTRIMAIGEAAEGFYRAMDEVNLSKTTNAAEAIKAIENGTVATKIIRGIQDNSLGRVPVVGDWVEKLFRNTPEQRGAAGQNRLDAAATLLRDGKLHQAIREYAAGRVDAANKILKESRGWSEWKKTQPLPAQEYIERAGIVALFEEETE